MTGAQQIYLKNTYQRNCNVAMALLGVAVLLAKSWFLDSLGSLAYDYLGIAPGPRKTSRKKLFIFSLMAA